ncbi:major facilitator superfamily domain-containing protein [Catenaria anguillulae PL171]|uniref:UNC93-like protein MFSD11 n=1 Tax=Catenaria anguillulae PL171 TaxID=765915 RepID=A0A1Y2HLZ5_9FUNG|nr:major facilitator superfamily domain-containing protein [Catenaria anguillulae PL171]
MTASTAVPDEMLADSARPANSRGAMLRAGWLGVGMLLVITAYNTAQPYITTLYPDHGFYSLALVYGVYIFTSIGAPYLTETFSASSILFAAGAFHGLFIVGLLWGTASLFAFAALVGVGNGMLWICQGHYITTCSTSFGVPIGRLSSALFTLLSLNMIIGNIAMAWLLEQGVDISTMLYILGGVAAVGSALLLFLPKPYAADSTPIVSAPLLSLPDQLRAMARVGLRRPLLDVVPLIAFHGSLFTFAFANFPLFMPADRPKWLQPAAYLGFGVAGTILMPIWGRLFDHRGAPPLVAGLLGIGILTYALSYWCILGGSSVPRFAWIAAMSSVGALDSVCMSLTNMSISSDFTSGPDVSVAFAVYRLVFGLGFISLALVSNLGLWQVVLGLGHVFLLTAVGAFVLRIRRGHGKVPRIEAEVLLEEDDKTVVQRGD